MANQDLNPSININGSLVPSSSSSIIHAQSSSMDDHHQDYSLLSTHEGISITPPGEERKPGFKWSADLQRRFVNAVTFLGGEQFASAKAIHQLLNEKDLTVHQVSNHLQIYKNNCYVEQLAREGAARAQMDWQNYPQQNNIVPNPVWTPVPIHYPQGNPADRLYIDPVGPMPPAIPPSMRVMDYSAPQPQTILFEGLFHDSKKMTVDNDDDEENATLELMSSGAKKLTEGSSSTTGNEIQEDVSLDLTLSIKPSSITRYDRFRRYL